MNTQRLIFKLTSWPVTLAICLLIFIGTLAIRLWPRTVPFDQCSKLYQKYAGHQGLQSAFIKDFRVDDTLFVDVTLIVATDSISWGLLKRELSIPELDSESQMQLGDDLVFTRQVNKHDNSQTIEGDSPDAELMLFSYDRKTICVLHVDNVKEKNAIINHSLKRKFKN